MAKPGAKKGSMQPKRGGRGTSKGSQTTITNRVEKDTVEAGKKAVFGQVLVPEGGSKKTKTKKVI